MHKAALPVLRSEEADEEKLPSPSPYDLFVSETTTQHDAAAKVKPSMTMSNTQSSKVVKFEFESNNSDNFSLSSSPRLANSAFGSTSVLDTASSATHESFSQSLHHTHSHPMRPRFGSRSHSNKQWPMKRPHLNNNQSSTSFRPHMATKNSSASNHSEQAGKIAFSMIPPCPNLVNQTCRCKEILSQNYHAQKIWSGCYRVSIENKQYHADHRDIDIAYYDGLFAKLMKFLQTQVDTDRVPTKKDMFEMIRNFGGCVIDDSNTLVIDRCSFLVFWRWFRGCLAILKDLYNLWDTRFPFKVDLFVGRAKCEAVLNSTPPGTFMLRLSQSQQNGLVLSYSESTFSRSLSIKHILLKRQQPNVYASKTNHHSQQLSDLHKLIRCFCKLQFLYTPTALYKKEHVF